MGRIWRGLKLGMKSLLLHKLRSGLTVLGIVFGVAAVISMLAIAEGSSRDAQEQIEQLGRDQYHRSLGQAERRGPGAPPAVPRVILNYGLKYDDYDRILDDRPDDQEGPADPRDPQADPPRAALRSTAGSSAPRHDYAEFNHAHTSIRAGS